MTISTRPFGVTNSGIPVWEYTMRNAHGMTACILSYGGILRRLLVPDRSGCETDVVLGYDALSDYERDDSHFGEIVGRCANRIKGSSFVLDGTRYSLSPNDGANHLHGVFGCMPFSARVFGDTLQLCHVSPPSEEGYPGTLRLCVSYRLCADNTLLLSYDARSDADTIVNLTNHTYFNLSGASGADIGDHLLRLDASHFLESDAQTCPTGAILPVQDTPMDFRTEKALGEALGASFAQLSLCGGLDHCYLLDRRGECAVLTSPRTGIRMTLSATQPALQLYTGNYLGSTPVGKGGVVYPRRGGVCLETQHCPDSPNHPEFPSVLLRSGEVYHHEVSFRFDAV